MQLRGIGIDQPEARFQLSLDLNGAGKSVLKNLFQLRDNVLNLEWLSSALHSTSKGQDLPYDICSPLGSLFNGIDHSHMVGIGSSASEELGRNQNGGEHIVQ